MKIWIDILTPKQLLFLTPLAGLLRQRGFELYLTTRQYRELTPLADLKGLSLERVGRHGGHLLEEKLRCSSLRSARLARRVHQEKVNLAVSFSSVEAARVAFGLSIPHICVSDSPHAEAVSRLTIPLSSTLYTPWVIPKEAWTSYGIEEEKVIQYRALDPAAWLKGFKPDSQILEKLGLSSKRPIIVLRPEEEKAAYMLNRGRSPIPDVMKTLIDEGVKADLVVVPRYEEQYTRYRKTFGDRVKVLRRPVDGASLLHYSKFFIGAGGTMTCEAALLGVPSLSCYPLEPTYVERYLQKEKLIQRSLEPEKIFGKVLEALGDEDYAEAVRKRARRILISMEDPIEVLAEAVSRQSRVV